jgi:hypothetical protein
MVKSGKFNKLVICHWLLVISWVSFTFRFLLKIKWKFRNMEIWKYLKLELNHEIINGE